LGWFSLLVTTKKRLWIITNETQINNSADIITSLNKEETQKCYDYLVTVDAKIVQLKLQI
jgi:hypothetical protein